MTRTRRIVPWLILLGLAGAVIPTHAEGPLGFWNPRDLDGMTMRRWKVAKNRTAEEVLKLNRELKTWPEACEAVLAAKEFAGNEQFLRQVADQLTDSTLTRLELTYRLIQWDRVRLGDLVFPGRGFVVYDDVFTVAGRANWILRTLTETSFGYVKPGATPAELATLQRTWRSYLAGEKPTPFERPFRSSNGEGEEELFDPLAIELIIRSLAPSPGKDALIQTCLTKVGVKELPPDPNNPAALCNPDIAGRLFLQQVTEVEDELSAEAWATWWTEHRERLNWNPDKARFESAPFPTSSNE